MYMINNMYTFTKLKLVSDAPFDEDIFHNNEMYKSEN